MEEEILTPEQDDVQPTDNSDVNTETEPETPDNSDSEAPEPENEQEQDGQFQTLEEANKAYAELRKTYGKQSTEVGNLRKQAQLAEQLQRQLEEQAEQQARENGFESAEEFENHKEIANLVADEYSKHINECEYPTEIKRLLAEYRENPSQETLNLVRAELPVETLENIAVNIAMAKGQLQAQKQEALNQQIYNSAREYLDENVNKYSDKFKNPAFKELYGEAFRAYGCDLQTDKLVSIIDALVDYEIKARGITQSINEENTKITDEIAGLTSTGGPQPDAQEKNILDMSPEEMRKELKKYR